MFLLNVLERPCDHGGEIGDHNGVAHFEIIEDVDFAAFSLDEFMELFVFGFQMMDAGHAVL